MVPLERPSLLRTYKQIWGSNLQYTQLLGALDFLDRGAEHLLILDITQLRATVPRVISSDRRDMDRIE